MFIEACSPIVEWKLRMFNNSYGPWHVSLRGSAAFITQHHRTLLTRANRSIILARSSGVDPHNTMVAAQFDMLFNRDNIARTYCERS